MWKQKNLDFFIHWGLRLSAVFVLLSKGIPAFNGSVKIREIMWSEKYFSWFIELLGINWLDWVGNAKYFPVYSLVDDIFGTLLVLGALHILLTQKFKLLYIFHFFVLFIVYFLIYEEGLFKMALIIEHCSQYLSPLIYLAYISNWLKGNKLKLVISLVIGLTFVGHGLYAADIYPVPGHFVTMCIRILGITEPQAIMFLGIIGYLDLICFPLLFFSGGLAYKTTLYYMLVWGFATAMARVFINFSIHYLDDAFTLFFVRTPHFVYPLILLFLFLAHEKSKNDISSNNSNEKFAA